MMVSAPPSKCPFTRTMNFLQGVFRRDRDEALVEARNLRVQVVKNGEERVNVYLPARSARWLIDLIPEDVLARIHEEGIPIERIQDELKNAENLIPAPIFIVEESVRTVKVWLE